MTTQQPVYVVVDLSDEDSVEIHEHSFTTLELAKEHVRGQFPDDGAVEFGDEDPDEEPWVYWDGNDLYNADGIVLYRIQKVTILR